MSKKAVKYILRACQPGDIESVRTLFTDYASALEIDLHFQNFDNELGSLPKPYVAPKGTLIVAENSVGDIVGCVGLKDTAMEGQCEMKRLFVVPEARKSGLGRKLVAAIVTKARALDYKSMVLDTLPSLTAARKLYQEAGFKETSAYYNTPIEETIFMELKL